MTDLVSLLYRADWTRLSLAAEVNTSRDLDLDRTRYGPGMPPGEFGEFGEFGEPRESTSAPVRPITRREAVDPGSAPGRVELGGIAGQ